MIAEFAIAVACGLAVGILSGLLGVGGGTIMVPLFRLAFGMQALASTATSLFTIIPTSISGAVSHIKGKTCIPRLGIALGLGGAVMSPLGVWLAQVSPSWLVMVMVALVIGYSAVTMLSKALKAPKEKAGDDMVRQIEAMRQVELSAKDMAKAVAIGAAAGLASGYVGLGGGFIMVPLMVSLLNMPMRLASGTSLVAVMILVLPAAIVQCALGNVDYLVGVAVACGSVPGALTGARLVKRVPERALRFVFAAFLGIAAILLVVNELGVI